MTLRKLNVFIVDDDASISQSMKTHLREKFGKDLNISIFDNGISCLEEVNENTHVVILDYDLNGKNGIDILQAIKLKNTSTEVIIYSNNEDIVTAIEILKQGAHDYVLKDTGSMKRISALIDRIAGPEKENSEEPKLTNYGAFLFFTFMTMAIAVTVIMKYSH